MKMDVHLVFSGKCAEAFAFYEEVFRSKVKMTMKYGDAPPEMPAPEGSKDLVMHTAMMLGDNALMGCDAPPDRQQPMGGFHVSITVPTEDEVKRIYTALSDGGTTVMPPMPTFWCPLFAMVDDKFGVGWMIAVPGPEM